MLGFGVSLTGVGWGRGGGMKIHLKISTQNIITLNAFTAYKSISISAINGKIAVLVNQANEIR